MVTAVCMAVMVWNTPTLADAADMPADSPIFSNVISDFPSVQKENPLTCHSQAGNSEQLLQDLYL